MMRRWSFAPGTLWTLPFTVNPTNPLVECPRCEKHTNPVTHISDKGCGFKCEFCGWKLLKEASHESPHPITRTTRITGGGQVVIPCITGSLTTK
jgi:hypothetical protein